MNRPKKPNCTSQYKGVNWSKSRQVWFSRIKLNGKQVFIGEFENERHAALAYDIWAHSIFGEFARPNFQAIN